MPVYLRTRSLFISLLLALYVQAVAQSLLPAEGGTERYAISIEMPRGYISGISIMKNDGERMICSVFNEFGVSAMDFTYDLNRKKVKLLSVMSMLDKWYIRRVLRKDLRALLDHMSRGETMYENKKRHIVYRFDTMKAEEKIEDME